MKKITLLTATVLALTCFGGQSIPTQAAVKNCNTISLKGNRVLITYGLGCDMQGLFDKLENCFPNITLPDCELPDNNAPEIDVPDMELPEVETPDTEAPDVNVPDNTPDTNLPETDAPGSNKPDSNDKPGGDNNTEENTPEQETPEDTTSHAYIQQVVDLVNIERAKEGLAPLNVNRNVQAAAQVRAKECEQSFSHTRPNGSSFATALKEQNVSYRSAGENIAWGQRSPKEVVNAWMNSSGHRANIMNPNFTTIGVGYYQNARGVNYWCQLFTR